tara:strand:+ start:108 stop:278 length:171 start_codon:yes stop_codon:yes gene_type:complete
MKKLLIKLAVLIIIMYNIPLLIIFIMQAVIRGDAYMNRVTDKINKLTDLIEKDSKA